jgi:hypothetical protein
MGQQSPGVAALRDRAERLFASSWPMLTGGGSAQIIYSAAAGRQSATHAGVISPHLLLPLGYEQGDVRLAGLQRACASR